MNHVVRKLRRTVGSLRPIVHLKSGDTNFLRRIRSDFRNYEELSLFAFAKVSLSPHPQRQTSLLSLSLDLVSAVSRQSLSCWISYPAVAATNKCHHPRSQWSTFQLSFPLIGCHQ